MKLKLIFLILSFLIGVFAGSNTYFGLSLMGVFVAFVRIITRSPRFIFYTILMFVIGVLRFSFSFSSDEPGNLRFFNNIGGNIELYGFVSDEPDNRIDAIKLTVSATDIRIYDRTYFVSGKVMINLPRYPEYAYGDRLKITGDLLEPEDSLDFSYKNYLARYDVYSAMYRPSVEFISQGGGNFFYGRIYDFKQIFAAKLNELFTEPSASFLAGLLMGSRKGIPDFVMEDFKTTGLTHIIAISGYNITLLIVIVTFLFGFLGRRAKVVAASIVIVVFTILVGASAAVVRASVMGIISLYALFWGRKGDLDLVLLFAAFIMTVWNPKIFVFDVGFQLSFLATMGLVYVSPFLMESRLCKCIPEFFGIRESFVMTLSAQALALPVILLNFKRFSLVSPLANILVLPLIPASMLFGFLSVVLYEIFTPLGIFVGYIADIFLKSIVLIAGFFAKIPYASFEVMWFTKAIFVLYYLVIGVLLFRSRDPL